MPVDLRSAVHSLRARIEDKGAAKGLVYPWWIAVIASVGQVAGMLVALLQRDALWPPDVVALAVVVTAMPHAWHFVRRQWLAWPIGTTVGLAAVAWVLSVPMSEDTAADAIVLVAALLVGEMTVTEGPRVGAFVAALCVGVMFVAGGPETLELGVASMLVAFLMGYTLRWQMRAIAAERTGVATARERAALEERQRIAREIHDLVAHSLSVTMLHVTGARRALTEDRDVDDAVQALEDAERIGRQAMADIRRTVGVLNSEPGAGAGAPLPGAVDIPALVDDIRAAGLEVDLEVDGDPSLLPESAGLSLFRAVQESLTNVAKHAPASTARVRVRHTPEATTLTVRNLVPGGTRRPRGDGSGLAGMSARIEQFGGSFYAGRDPRDDAAWLVDLRLPSGDAACAVRKWIS